MFNYRISIVILLKFGSALQKFLTCGSLLKFWLNDNFNAELGNTHTTQMKPVLPGIPRVNGKTPRCPRCFVYFELLGPEVLLFLRCVGVCGINFACSRRLPPEEFATTLVYQACLAYQAWTANDERRGEHITMFGKCCKKSENGS